MQFRRRGERWPARSSAALALLCVLGTLGLTSRNAAAESPVEKPLEKKELHYPVQANASVSIVNEFGAVTVKPAPDHRVSIVVTPHSDKVEVDAAQNGNRVDARSHVLKPGIPAAEAAVDYEVAVPADVNLSVRSGNGSIHVEGLSGDITLQGETATIEARATNNAHLHLRTVSGAITLSDIRNAHIDATSLGGNVTLTSVAGPKVTVSTTRGAIRYDGDPGQGGDYELINHNGDIEVALPATASVDLTARTVNGAVQNDFPLQQKAHTSFALDARSLAGTAASGSCMIRLSSFSGKIHVHKK